MSQIGDFLKECGFFYVLTVNGEFPAGRPFGAVLEYNDTLYISTGDMKSVYNQLKKHPQMQIIALKSGTHDWMRISGIATECMDMFIKKKMWDGCPALKRHFASPEEPHYVVFKIDVVEFNCH